MRTLLWIVCFLVGCGSPCETACGLVSDTASCEELNEQEAKALESFEIFVSGWDRSWTCDKLRGYEVKIDPTSDGNQFLRDGQYILGYTDCRPEVRAIVTANENWKINAFSHELGHALEGCLGPPILPHWHYGWQSRGLGGAVNNAVQHGEP